MTMNQSEKKSVSKIICDANLSWNYVEALRKELPKDEIIYVNDKNNGYNTYGGMTDQAIIGLGFYLGGIPICTCNPRHFTFYDNIIPLPSRKSVKKLIEETKKYLPQTD